MSRSLIDQLKSQITPQLVGYAAKTLGETPANTSKAIDAALPAILAGLSAETRLPSGLTSVARLIGEPINDGTLLNQLPALYQGTMTAAPTYRLGSQVLHAVFGSKLGAMTQAVGLASGMKPTSSALLVSMLGPHVTAITGQRLRSKDDTSPAGLARLMEGENASIESALTPAMAQVFGAPGMAAAAATAATGVTATTAASAAGARKPAEPDKRPAAATVTPRGSSAAATGSSSASPRPVTASARTTATARPRSSGPALWPIFPIGLIAGTGLFGLGSLLKPALEAPGPAPIVVTFPETPKAAAPKTTEIPKTAEVKKPDVKAAEAKKPDVKAAPAKVDPPKVAEATKPGKPAEKAAVKEPVKEASKIDPPKIEVMPLTPPGVTSYFGTQAVIPEAPARLNPDYKPLAAAAAATAAAVVAVAPKEATKTSPPKVDVMPLTPPGTTSFYGSSPAPAEAPARFNPDYKPQAVAVAPAPPAPTAPAAPLPAPVAGVTSYFGIQPGTTDKPAVANPNYKPAPLVVAEAPIVPPVAAAPAAPKSPGVTSYFGINPTPADKPAVMNPDYKPTAAATAPAAPAPVATAPAPEAASCQSTVTAAVKSGPILFQNAQAVLTGASTATLDRVAAAFAGCSNLRLRVEGHTDNVGNADMNQRLSEARANTVANYLASKGVDAKNLSPAGFGMTKPVAPNTTLANKALNRRIEFVVDK